MPSDIYTRNHADERQALELWLEGRNTSPLTGQQMQAAAADMFIDEATTPDVDPRHLHQPHETQLVGPTSCK